MITNSVNTVNLNNVLQPDTLQVLEKEGTAQLAIDLQLLGLSDSMVQAILNAGYLTAFQLYTDIVSASMDIDVLNEYAGEFIAENYGLPGLIVEYMTQSDVSTGLDLNTTLKNAVIAAFTAADIYNNISNPTKQAVVVHTPATNVINALKTSGSEALRNATTVGVYTQITDSVNTIFSFATIGTHTVTHTASGSWNIAGFRYINTNFTEMLTLTVAGSPIPPGTPFTVGNGDTIAIEMNTTTPNAYVILDGFKLF